MRRGRRILGFVLPVFVLLTVICAGSPGAQAAGEPPGPGSATDAKIDTLIQLLSDPDVRHRLERTPAHDGDHAPHPAAGDTMSSGLGTQLGTLRDHLVELGAAVGDLPGETGRANAMAQAALSQWGVAKTLAALAAFVALGFFGQWLFHLGGSSARRWLVERPLVTAEDRLRAVFARLAYGLGIVVTYALFSIGAFLLFEWPPLIQAVLLGALIAVLLVRLTAVVSRFLLAPAAERFRVVPVTTTAAWFLHKRLIAMTVIAGGGWQALGLATRFGISADARELIADALGLVLLALALDILWRRPGPDADAATVRDMARRRLAAVLLTVALFALWLVWTAGAQQAAALLGFAIALPIVIGVSRASVHHITREDGADQAHSFSAILFERGMRSVIVIGAALLLAWILDIDIVSLTMRDTIGTRIVRGLISVVVIGLAADFLWTLIRALIDSKLTRSTEHGPAGVDAGHAARLQTLLPTVGNILLATIVIIAGMMMLSALGVQIGPLIASAGVVGVAIGFGAQTLVRDVISGIFYLVDDAFRIGEYIQSGNYKGTVESFSLRSVKLRHQRGALYTVPFGVLGAVQNQSRDWVVDKIVMNVPYGTDLEKVRKLIKRIGTTLAEDPEFGPEIITPLKMQGVQQFGDYAIQIQTKMMTKPGDVQFVTRRRALLLIKQAFEENGIGFAVPTVQVAGDNPAAAAAGLAIMTVPKAAE